MTTALDLHFLVTLPCQNSSWLHWHSEFNRIYPWAIIDTNCNTFFESISVISMINDLMIGHLSFKRCFTKFMKFREPVWLALRLDKLGWGPYLSRGNCIRILWQKMKCIRILGHKWIHMYSDQINIFSACHNFKTNGNDLGVLINGPIDLSFN